MAYFTSGSGKAGCTGAMSYYTAGGEPPGRWAGQAAAGLGLSGEVDPGVIKRLYQDDIAPTGELLSPKRTPKSVREREDAAVAAYAAAHPFASAVELAQVRVAERGKDPHKVPYFDVTIMCVKSVSVLHASYRVAAEVARKQGDDELANQLDGKADRIEAALYEVALAVLSWLERHGCYTRTGYHSSTTGEWRDGDGFAAALFLHHISRDGDPHLHVHIPVLNRVQRDDGADQKWRTLDSRTLHAMRLGAAALADRLMETKLTAMGLRMVEREDGNGAEVGGVSREVMETFSSRAVAVTGELKRLAEEYERAHGKPPSARTLWLLHQQAGQNTRKSTTRLSARSRARPVRLSRRPPNGSPRGSGRPRPGKCRPYRTCTKLRKRSHGSPNLVQSLCWMPTRKPVPPGSRSRGYSSTTRCGGCPNCGSRCTGRCPCSGPTRTRSR